MSGAASPLRRLLGSSGILALLYGGSAALTFLVGVVLARFLGPAGYGTYALAMTSATLAGMITEFGLPVLVMREVGTARADDSWGKVAGLLHWADRALLVLSVLLVAATWAGVAIFAAERGSDYLATMLWAVALVPFVAIGKLRALALLALDRVLASQFPVLILRPGLFLLGCLGMVLASGKLTASMAMAVQVGSAALAMVVSLALFRRFRPAGLAKARPERAVRDWLGACLPMGLTEGLRLLQGQLGLLLTGALAGTAQAGLYRVADAVTQVTGIVISIVGTAATPMFARLWRETDSTGLQRVAAASAWAMFLGSLALGLPIALGGPWLFPMVFGAGFGASASLFVILWGGSLVTSLLGLTLSVANMTGQHLLSTRAFAVIAVGNLALGALLVPAYGALGAAFASAIASLAGTAYCALALRQRTGIDATAFNRESRLWLKDRIRFRGTDRS